MTNEQIDYHLKAMSCTLPSNAELLAQLKFSKLERELEILNTRAAMIWSILCEIAKRLPEPKDPQNETRT